jgi:ABC-type polysaccharide/polyol phosphate export permease
MIPRLTLLLAPKSSAFTTNDLSERTSRSFDRTGFSIFSSGSHFRRYRKRVQTEQELHERPPAMRAQTRQQRALVGRVEWFVGLLDLLWVLTQSDLRFRYGRGPWRFIRWFLEPFALVGVYLILLTFVLDRPGTDVGLSLACAVVPFQFVILTVMNAMGALEVRRPILLNMKFRRMLIPTASAMTESLGFASSFFLIVLMMAAYKVAPTWSVFWFPLVLLVNLLFAAAAAYPAVIFGIWLRELRAFVVSFIRVLFFLSPGLVPLSEARPDVRHLLEINPLTGLFEAYRAVFMFGRAPEAWQLLYPLAATAILLAVFVPVYRIEQRQFAKVI